MLAKEKLREIETQTEEEWPTNMNTARHLPDQVERGEL